MSPIPHCISIMRAARAGCAHRDTFLFILAGLALVVGLLGVSSATYAAHLLTIDTAQVQDTDLFVEGHRQGGNPNVTVDVYADPNSGGMLLGSFPATNEDTGQGNTRERLYQLKQPLAGIDGNPCRVEVTSTSPPRVSTPVSLAVDNPACDQQQNNPPVVTNPGDQTNTEGDGVSLQIFASDPDAGDTLTYAATELPLSLTIDTTTGVISGTIDVGAAASSPYIVTVTATDDGTPQLSDSATFNWTVNAQGVNNPPIANDDNFVVDTAVIDRNGQADVPAPGVLINDTDPDPADTVSAVAASGSTALGGTYNLLVDGSFSYVPPTMLTVPATDSFSYTATDGTDTSASATVTLPVQTGLVVNGGKNRFNIMMNYELGMHCTGFEFAYCCVLPPYNSILAQVARSDKGTNNESDFPMLLEGDPTENLDFLGRETVLREPQLADVDANGNGDTNFNKYVLRYWHDAQPRNDGRGRPQSSTLISAVEANSMFMWNTVYDAAATNMDNSLRMTGDTDEGAPDDYNGSVNVVVGDGDYDDVNDNYGSGWMNHFYIYQDLEGTNDTETSAEINKIRLGLQNLTAVPAVGDPPALSLVIPDDCGPAFHPMGPDTQNGIPGAEAVPNDCGGVATRGNLLTFSEDSGTVVFTQMKVLENLPVMLTSPRIWEALGLPLTPFEDTIDFFGDPGLVDEDSIRPYVAMKAQLHHYDPAALNGDGVGDPVIDDGLPVIGFGTAPIDIPNCERCHSELSIDSENSAQQDDPSGRNFEVAGLVQEEMDFWNFVYGINTAAGDSDWYSRLKGAAISILAIHDNEHGTSFSTHYPGVPDDSTNPGFGTGFPQNTRLGHESVICQKCHADSVIAVVKSASCGPGSNCVDPADYDPDNPPLILPITEAIHDNHRNISEIDNNGDQGIITFADSLGRDGGCQGCHPAHRSDGDMDGYPITLQGDNFYADADNRDANGGCFVGRDVHSNRFKDDPGGADTPEHLNAVGQWLSDNVYSDQHDTGGDKGIWCTNCHQQLGQEIWRNENMPDLIHNRAACSAGPNLGQPCNVDADCGSPDGFCGNIRGRASLAEVAAAIGVSEAQAIAWLDPNANNPLGDFTHANWDANPGICDYVVEYTGGGPISPAQDATVATVELLIGSGSVGACTNTLGPNPVPKPAAVTVDCNPINGGPVFQICGSLDVDDDFNVALVGNTEPDNGLLGGVFCTTPDCVSSAQATLNAVAGSIPCATLADGENCAAPVPFSAASDGRDHWLAAGEPHCADCHAAPYTEQSGNINAFPPFNYPRKASLMRYSRGHQDISCQGCHESIHGLYPVTPTIDTTSYAQAINLNHDGSHGPVKCGACHDVDNEGIPSWIRNNPDGGTLTSITDFDSAIGWAHTYTEEDSVLNSTCRNCHGVEGNNWLGEDGVDEGNEKYLEHASSEPSQDLPRSMMDKAETELFGAPFSSTDGTDGVCLGCHDDKSGDLMCTGEKGTEWKLHLTEGRVAQSTWETVAKATGNTCGW